MKKLTLVLFIVVLTVALAVPVAFADHNVGPCNDSGEPGNSDYAQHHIVPADLGHGGHIPGRHHGFSVCDPSGDPSADPSEDKRSD